MVAVRGGGSGGGGGMQWHAAVVVVTALVAAAVAVAVAVAAIVAPVAESELSHFWCVRIKQKRINLILDVCHPMSCVFS